MLGFLLQLGSLLISGLIEPHARFAYRATEFESRVRAFVGTDGPARFHQLGKYVVLSGAARPFGAGGFFVQERLGTDTDRVMVARSASFAGPNENGQYLVQLNDVNEAEIKSRPLRAVPSDKPGCENCGPAHSYTVSDGIQMGKYSRQILMDDFIRLEPRGASAAEWTFPDFIGRLVSQQPVPANLSGEMAKRFVRSLLCLISPLVAALAVAFANRSTQAFALPVASAGLMALDISGTAIVKAFAPAALPIAAVFIVGGVVAVVLMWQTASRAHSLVTPAIARA